MTKKGLATVWLDGCSGCHMSLLDIDEHLFGLGEQVNFLYSPLVDCKKFPEWVDITLVEGAVGNEADVKNILSIRERSRILVSLGDCAVTANVSAMRNRFPVSEVLGRAYLENADAWQPDGNDMAKEDKDVSFQGIPTLCRMARPVHAFVRVDVFLPGCPPPSAAILYLLSELLQDRIPEMKGRTRFGA